MITVNLYARFYEIIARIPRGTVATYGQISNLAGYPGYARQVGFALHSIPDDLDLPWHRVINSRGMISIKAVSPFESIQRQMLEAEGISFDSNGRVPLKKYLWNP